MNLDTKILSHSEIITKLQNEGYNCFLKPLTVSADFYDNRFLKKDGTITLNHKDKNIVWQQICVLPREGCAVRIKMDGFPKNIRNYPHSTKAVLINSTDVPSYENEAFKITYHGKALPKSPYTKLGLSTCPYKENKGLCSEWIDQIMADCHPRLTFPIPSAQLRAR